MWVLEISAAPIQGGMSGSPILNADGALLVFSIREITFATTRNPIRKRRIPRKRCSIGICLVGC